MTAHSSISALLNHDVSRDHGVAALAPGGSINSTPRDQDQDDGSDNDDTPDNLLYLEMQQSTQEDDDVAMNMLEDQSSVLSDTENGKFAHPYIFSLSS